MDLPPLVSEWSARLDAARQAPASVAPGPTAVAERPDTTAATQQPGNPAPPTPPRRSAKVRQSTRTPARRQAESGPFRTRSEVVHQFRQVSRGTRQVLATRWLRSPAGPEIAARAQVALGLSRLIADALAEWDRDPKSRLSTSLISQLLQDNLRCLAEAAVLTAGLDLLADWSLTLEAIVRDWQSHRMTEVAPLTLLAQRVLREAQLAAADFATRPVAAHESPTKTRPFTGWHRQRETTATALTPSTALPPVSADEATPAVAFALRSPLAAIDSSLLTQLEWAGCTRPGWSAQAIVTAALVVPLVDDFDPSEQLALIAAALLQDVGVPIQRQRPPEAQRARFGIERAQPQHPAHGAAWLAGLRGVPSLWPLLVGSHHERADGSGFPQRLTGHRFTRMMQALAFCVRMAEQLLDPLTKPLATETGHPLLRVAALRIDREIRRGSFSATVVEPWLERWQPGLTTWVRQAFAERDYRTIDGPHALGGMHFSPAAIEAAKSASEKLRSSTSAAVGPKFLTRRGRLSRPALLAEANRSPSNGRRSETRAVTDPQPRDIRWDPAATASPQHPGGAP